MFIIDKKNKSNQENSKKPFQNQDLRAGKSSEWLANNPTSLGEDLLIIQKEFMDLMTPERLDLLALDKQGNLVIIENKLDDTGRDVTWQF